MLGKLMHYEFKATGRIFLPIYGALLIISLVSRLFMNLQFGVPTVIGITVSVIMIIGICVITLLLTLQRFYKNLLGSEGYLMFTLPVSTDSLIWSKLLVASVWSVLSGIVVFLAVLIMSVTSGGFRAVMDSIIELLHHIQLGRIDSVFYIIELVIAVILSLFSNILLLYVCMALSLFVNKHRGLFAFGTFVVINIIGQILSGILAAIAAATDILHVLETTNAYLLVHLAFVGTIIGTLIIGAVFYLVTRYMLKNRLNLE